MKIKPTIALIMLFVLFLTTSATGSSWDHSGCSILSPVNPGNVSVSQLHELFRSVVNVCRNEGEEAVFLYITGHIKSNISKSMKSKKEYAGMYCQYFLRSNEMLHDHPESGDHSIVMEEGRRSGCGHPQSYWMVHTRDEKQKRVFRLKLAYEKGKLLINDH